MTARWSFALACALLYVASAAQADDIIPPKIYTTTPGGLNVADGSFTYSVTDISIGSITFERFVVNGNKKPNAPLMGKNMSHNFDIYVAPNIRPPAPPPNPLPDRYRPIVHIGSSASGEYAQAIGSSAISPNSIEASMGILEMSGGNYVYTDSSGTIFTFTSAVPAAGVPNGSQRIAQIAFPEGRVRSFSYDASNQLKLISDSSGYAIVLDYNAAGQVSAACGFNLSATYVTAATTCAGAALKTSYAYDANGLIVSATDVLGQTTNYDGNVLGSLPCVRPPGYSVCKITNTITAGKVFTQTMADGAVWHVSSGNPDTVNDPDVVEGRGATDGGITDPDNKPTSIQFTKTSPYTVTDANTYTTTYDFYGAKPFDDLSGLPDYDGKLMRGVTLPEGGQYLAEYGGPFRTVTKETLIAKPGSGLPDRVKTLTYAGCTPAFGGTLQNCAKPISVVDPRNNETDYTYYDFGATATLWSPAPAPGAARPLKLYGYTQIYAYVKNASGTLVPSGAPIWMLTSETQCQSAPGSTASPPTCDPAATQIVTAYQYGAAGTANTLLLRGKVVDSGTGKLNLRTCYGYDNQGNRIWETSPRAGLATCP